MIGFIIGICIGYFFRPLVTLILELIIKLWVRYKDELIKLAVASVK
ncbi:hypothetical protein SDC9_192901 [bioreactor metagenome]|uniref:Uncharacterized protein n=1 Tax=bioreactor metagenome TaxID=1076179 RepID=A0A645IAH8_9ZZZZ